MSSLNSPSGALLRLRETLPDSLRREFILNPITTLVFYTSPANGQLYLLAGEDNRIKIYDVETSRLCGAVDIFPAQSVHGITVNPSNGVTQRILVWGGYSVAVVPIKAVESIISGGTGGSQDWPVVTAKASDWIFEGVISSHETDELALLTAHNDLIRGRFDEEKGLIEFLEMVSPSRPILYSGNLSWEEPDCILVAAGTVFGEIVVWKYHTAATEQECRCEVLFVFSGHEGSIFGVHISPTIKLGTGESLRLLASCSDDRTIRIWDITDLRDLSRSTHDEYQKKILEARQTGFGDSIDATSQEETSARCLAVAMGHISRIWQVQFPDRQLMSNDSSSIELWSFGEDATAQKWCLSLGNTQPSDGIPEAPRTADVPTRTRGQLKNEAIFANHSGKNIWSHAMALDKENHLSVVTGAQDGKISIIDNTHGVASERKLDDVPPLPVGVSVENFEKPESTIIADISETPNLPTADTDKATSAADAEDSISDNLPKAPKKKQKVKKPAKDFFNRYALLSDGSLLASTKNGRFFVGSTASESSWTELFLPGEYANGSSTYAVVKGSMNASAAFVGTAEGNIFMYRSANPSRLEHLAQVHGKVSDIFPLSAAKGHGNQSTQDSQIRLLVTVLGSESASLIEFDLEGDTSQLKQIQIPVDKRFIVTSATIHEDLVILGSRTGYISILQATDDGYTPQYLVEPKTNDCVTSISILPPKPGADILYFLSTSRDGKFRIYSTYKSQEQRQVTLIHETSPPFGPIIEGAWFSTSQEGTVDLILYGFRSTKFVVWNETQRREIATIECGGGHRTFVYDPLPAHPDGFRLVWTQASQLCFFSQTHAPHRALKSGGHGREIKAVSSSGNRIATAAEDTAIRIWSYESPDPSRGKELQCLAVLENHTAGIQSMKWYKQSHLFSSAGNKEFFVWRISHLDSYYQGLAVKCEAAYPDRTDDVDLRIMNFDVHCLDETSDESPLFYISMVLSNSTLLTYTYSEKAGFKLIAKGSYTGACMTQLRHLHVGETTIQTLTAATDGHMAIWEAKLPASADTGLSEYTGLLATKLHQSTMKSLDIRAVSTETGTSYIIATGGDDDGLGITHLLRDAASGTVAVKSKSIVRSAHAAAVTGIGILNLSSDNRDAVVVSCSNDQRVKRWQVIGWQGDQVRIKLLDNRYSSVADVGDLDIIEEARRFAVGGVGLEIWDVAGNDDSISC